MRPASIVLALLFLPTALASAQASLSFPLYIAPPASQSCPVKLTATRKSGFQLHSVESGKAILGQQLRLSFGSAAGTAILKADLIVHGARTSGHEGLLLTRQLGISRSTSESVQLTGTASAPLQSPMLSTKDMTAISWIEVARLEFADGSVWQSSEKSRCVAAPSLMVLVDSGD